MAGATWNCCRFGASLVYTIQPCKHHNFIWSRIRRIHVSLAVSCHLHFWQNGRDPLRVTVVILGWNGYWNTRQSESWPWRRKFSSRSCQDSNPRPFDHESIAYPGWLWFSHSYAARNILQQPWCLFMLMSVCCDSRNQGEVSMYDASVFNAPFKHWSCYNYRNTYFASIPSPILVERG